MFVERGYQLKPVFLLKAYLCQGRLNEETAQEIAKSPGWQEQQLLVTVRYSRAKAAKQGDPRS